MAEFGGGETKQQEKHRQKQRGRARLQQRQESGHLEAANPFDSSSIRVDNARAVRVRERLC